MSLTGQPGVPLLLTNALPLYREDKGVQAEVYSNGTSTSPGNLLTTLNLLHQSGGVYSVLYTPPEEHSVLDIIYKVYTDTTYTTLDKAYLPIKDQLNVQGLGGAGRGYPLGEGSTSRIGLTDKEIEKIINGVIKEIKPLVNVEIPKVDLSGTNELIKDSNSKLVQFSTDIQKSINEKIKNTLKAIETKKEDKTTQKQIVKLVSDLQNLQKDNHKRMQEQVNTVDQKVNHLDHIKVGNRVEELLAKSNKKTDESNNKAFQIMILEMKKDFETMRGMQKTNSQDLKTIKLLTTLLDKFINKQSK